MWPTILFAALFLTGQTRISIPPTPYMVLAAEYTRGTDVAGLAVLENALTSGDTTLQRLAVRALGRWEDSAHRALVIPMLSSPSAAVRREALNTYGQMRIVPPVHAMQDGSSTVRAAYFETLGRVADATPDVYTALLTGLTDDSEAARIGAARGIESLTRRTARKTRLPPDAVTAIRAAVRANANRDLRQLLLLTLNAAGDRDTTLLIDVLGDSSAMVRRLAVMGLRRFVDDRSAIVRYQSLRFAERCDQLVAAVGDASDHVSLAAIDAMGEKRCDATLLDSLTRKGANWRVKSHALVALAHRDTVRAKAALPRFVRSTVWQARTYAAAAAKVLKDSATLSILAHDTEPNVAIAAMTTVEDAVRGLQASHYGLVLASATRLKSAPQLASYQAEILASLRRLSARNEATTRDPRVALLQRLHESATSATAEQLRGLLSDVDPVVAEMAARVMTEKTGMTIVPVTTAYAPAPFPSRAALEDLQGATARIQMRNGASIELTLFPDEAPVTVATFVALAEHGAYRGLTWHRIVPNFVLQGGSPGADEYDGLTKTFLRDEVGWARNARGSFGISTRGRDTGDGQIFINLVDNFRLDHDYTVFAQAVRGYDVIDRLQEGDVIDKITIQRRR